MTQTKLGSLYEAFMNILIGFAINFTANAMVFPLFGVHITAAENFHIGLIYTGISIARQFVIRRWFNAKLRAAAQRLAGVKSA